MDTIHTVDDRILVWTYLTFFWEQGWIYSPSQQTKHQMNRVGMALAQVPDFAPEQAAGHRFDHVGDAWSTPNRAAVERARRGRRVFEDKESH